MGSHLYARMITQGGNKASILRQIKQVFQRYPETVLWDTLQINQQNNYALKSKLQLDWQKIYICMYVCLCLYVREQVELMA